MGCVVNGPGESKAANIGISLPGTGEAPNCPVFIDGEHFTTLRGTYDELAEGFRALVDNYVADEISRSASRLSVVGTEAASLQIRRRIRRTVSSSALRLRGSTPVAPSVISRALR